MKPSVTDFIRTLVVLICALAFCSPLLAQEPQFDDLAKDMTDALVKSKQYKVTVVDFFAADGYKTDGEMNDVGRKLGRRFSRGVASAKPRNYHGRSRDDDGSTSRT